MSARGLYLEGLISGQQTSSWHLGLSPLGLRRFLSQPESGKKSTEITNTC